MYMKSIMNKKWIIVLLIVAYVAFFVSGLFSIQVHKDATNIKNEQLVTIIIKHLIFQFGCVSLPHTPL